MRHYRLFLTIYQGCTRGCTKTDGSLKNVTGTSSHRGEWSEQETNLVPVRGHGTRAEQENMPIYRVKVTCEAWVSAFVEVNAPNETSANKLAPAQAQENAGEMQWSYDGLVDGSEFTALPE
jgi:hypothetical protein